MKSNEFEINKSNDDRLKVYTSDITRTLNWFFYFCMRRNKKFLYKNILSSFERFNDINNNILPEAEKSKCFKFVYDEDDKLKSIKFTLLDDYRIKLRKNDKITINI